jgi:hypothetical protein
VLVLEVLAQQQVAEPERLVAVYAVAHDRRSDADIPSSPSQRRNHTYREKRKVNTFHSRRCEIVQCECHDAWCRYSTGGQFTMRDGEFCLKRPVGEIANRPLAILYLLSEPAGASATKRAYRSSFPFRSASIRL